MTNPDNAIGTNGAYNGRTSVNAFNDDLAVYTGRGIISGFVCQPSSGMTVTIGGSGTVRDVAIVQNPSGDKTTVNNRLGSPIEVTLPNAPASNARVDSIVAYVDGTPQGEPTVADNPSACGLIVVSGTVASNPSAPTESQIRSAITADGGSGANAYWMTIADVRVSSGTTVVTDNMIYQGAKAPINIDNLGGINSFDFSSYQEVGLFTSNDFTGGWEPTLADSVANYEFVTVEFAYNTNGATWQTASVFKFDPNNNVIVCPIVFPMYTLSTIVMATARIVLSGNKLQYVDSQAITFTSTGSLSGFGDQNQIIINRIIGWKRITARNVIQKGQ